jgi:hypothetical protein
MGSGQSVERRSRRAVLPLACVALLVQAGSLSSSANQATGDSLLARIRFLDSTTGYAVQPDEVLILETDRRTLVSRSAVAAALRQQKGQLSLPLPPGAYEFKVRAKGYVASRATFVLDEHAPQRIDFHLDPLVAPPELASGRLQALHRAEATLVVGFVVDDETGQPLTGVDVRDVSGQARACTNARGFFELRLAVPLVANRIATTDVIIEKHGYLSERRQYVELMPGGDWIYRIRLSPGEGARAVDERQFRRRGRQPSYGETASVPEPESETEKCRVAPAGRIETRTLLGAPVNVPRTIRLGRNCPSADACTAVEVYGLETYAKGVLPAEWFPCWGSLAGGMNSLMGGAVPIRSYGSWHVYNPRTVNYDICDTASCQVFGSATTTNTNTAVDQTTGVVLVDFNRNIFRTEYSAEQNNTGCGDCSTGQCTFDPVCCGSSANGHGRGMCQYGTVRWATGTRVSVGSCSLGPQLTYGSKDWQGLLLHYYPALTAVQGSELQAGDRIFATENLDVRNNPGAGCGATLCSNDATCPTCILCTATTGSTGVVVGGATQADGQTWWQIQWDAGSGNCAGGTTGWSLENTFLRESPGVVVELNADTLYFTATAGQANPTTRGSTIREANRRSEAWTASTNVPWATLVAASGQTPDLIRISANTAGLAAGTHTGQLTVQSPTNAFGPLVVSLVLVLHSGLVGNVERGVATTQNRVDGYDLARLLRAFGSVPGTANWDPAVNLVDIDANSNGVIDPNEMVIDSNDLTALTSNFGKTG